MKKILKYTVAVIFACLVPALLIVIPYAYSELRASDTYGVVRVTTFFEMAFVISGAHVIILGLPIFIVLKIKNWVSAYSSILLGFISGAVPISVWTWPLKHSELHTSSSHWANGKMVQTIIDGTPTLEGWLSFLEAAFVMGLFGAIGGLAFWLSLRYVGPDSALRHSYAK